MLIDLDDLYICWSPRILSAILNAGFELWEDPEGTQDNPFLYIKKRVDENGVPQTQKTGYIFERTPELMVLVGKYSNQKKKNVPVS